MIKEEEYQKIKKELEKKDDFFTENELKIIKEKGYDLYE